MSNVFEVLHIGIDDVDSPSGGCTTHAAYRLVKGLLSNFRNLKFIDYPNLVRLNPAIPFKTRGNGAVAIRVAVRKDLTEEVVGFVANFIEQYVKSYEFRADEDYAVALVIGEVPKLLTLFYKKALTDFVHIDYLRRTVQALGDRCIIPLGIRRGLVGALAAIGWFFECDCTYELIAYRSPENREPERCIDAESVKLMDVRFRDVTFVNFDYEKNRPLISPHGPDPVLLGIRGEDPRRLVEAFRMLKICEDVEGYMIFRTNQGTDAHLINRDLRDFRVFQTGCSRVLVDSKPKVLPGGDVILRVRDVTESGTQHTVWVAVFKETGLTQIVKELVEGDEVYVCGTMKYWEDLGPVIHLEKIRILKLTQAKVLRNPRCPKCGARMKSAGKNKGWKCLKCGYRTKTAEKEVVYVPRKITEGEYVPKDSAIKHLVKPARRYGRERLCIPAEPIDCWIM